MNKINQIITDFKVEINDHRLFLISENLYDPSVGYSVFLYKKKLDIMCLLLKDLILLRTKLAIKEVKYFFFFLY